MPLEDAVSDLLAKFTTNASPGQKDRLNHAANAVFKKGLELMSASGQFKAEPAKDGYIDPMGVLKGITPEKMDFLLEAKDGFVRDNKGLLEELSEAAHEVYKTNGPRNKRILQEMVLEFVTGKAPAHRTQMEGSGLTPEGEKAMKVDPALADWLLHGKVPPGAVVVPEPLAPNDPPAAVQGIRAFMAGMQTLVRETPIKGLLLKAVDLPENATEPNVELPAEAPAQALPKIALPPVELHHGAPNAPMTPKPQPGHRPVKATRRAG